MKDDIMKLNTFGIYYYNLLEDVYILLDNKTRTLNDTTPLIFSILLKKYDFDNNFFIKNRTNLEVEVIDNLTKSKEKTKKLLELRTNKIKERVSFVEVNLECNSEWSICILDTEFRNNIINHLVLRSNKKELKIVEDYFSSQNIHKISKNIKNDSSNFQNILIERKTHICSPSQSLKNQEQEFIFDQEFDEKIDFRNRSLANFVPEDNMNYSKFIYGINNKCNKFFS